MRELLEYFLYFTENLNLNTQLIVEQLGVDPMTKEIGKNYISQRSINRASTNSNSLNQNFGVGGDAGPGGSPHTFLGLHSFKNTESMSQSLNQPVS